MVNVHASGGSKMMQAAAQALADFGADKPLLIAVTVLTSMEQTDLTELGISRSVAAQVSHLADLTKQAGLDGVVCSAQEAALLKQQCGRDFCLVTPGIRPAFAGSDDQKRVMTPSQALAVGVDYLVIGRPITKAANPLQALQAIYQEIRH